MKTLKYLAICAAAFTFAACNVEEPAAPQKSANLVTVNFGAEAVEPLTKATLTPGETTFTAEWSVGDQISVSYANEQGDMGVATATWNGSSFEAELPEFEGIWVYNAIYPAIGEYDFSKSTQTGAAYNSIPDLMACEELIVDGAAGKDENGNNLVFPMVRSSAILYFHFTSNLEEKVIGATLSTENGDIAYSNVNIYYYEDYGSIAVDWESPVSTIELSTSQDASDFTLWFNVEMDTLENLTLTVTTESGKTFKLTRAGEVYYTAGIAYTVDMAIADQKWEEPVPGFVKVTSAPTDFTGRYLIVDDAAEGDVKVFNGEDSVSDFIEAAAVNGVVEDNESLVAVDIAPMDGGYSVKIIGGDKDGNYISGTSGSNTIKYTSSPVANEITFADGKATILSNGTSLRFNATSGQDRFRYYKTTTTGNAYHLVSLYKFNGKIQTIAATGIELAPTALSLKVGRTATLTATVTPANATNKGVIWESSDEDVATVVDGKVTAIAEGEAEITATVVGTELSASCNVTVSAAEAYTLEELVAEVEPTKDGVTVTVALDNETITGIAMSGTYRNGVFLMAGEKEIEIYCKNVPEEWIVGGTISGTVTCPWKVYSSTWELCPTSWDDFDYVAPAVAPTYSVNVPTVEGGTIVADPVEAEEGETVTVTATPAEGYVLSSLTAGVSGEALSGNVLTFTMPGKDVTISASFASASAESAEFGPDWNALFGTSYTGSVTGVKANQFTLSGASNGVSIEVNNGSSLNGYVKSGDFRLYNGYTMTFAAPTGKNITKITATKGGKSIASIAASTGTLTIAADAASMTWEGESNSVTFSVTATMGFSAITVFYE